MDQGAKMEQVSVKDELGSLQRKVLKMIGRGTTGSGGTVAQDARLRQDTRIGSRSQGEKGEMGRVCVVYK